MSYEQWCSTSKHPLLRNGFRMFYDNARLHITRCVQDVLQQNNVDILLNTPYSPDVALCDFWLFPQLMKPLQSKHIVSNKACVKDAEAVLKKISQNGLLHVFKKWTES
ncbi:histone-lysine N-methyltransferase SETMAR [Trichonephila clavata]|uniref:Histone-lysine N-methyltransferase SETMAR n=1 Tax=Trichonephila clavata TaxID=2740835 RepID=A0A8X6JQD4_TRICU|nr:histone-lysine N-methyltransferase SETMAR [Trichonephila clavata]